jgi:hypothetical protein
LPTTICLALSGVASNSVQVSLSFSWAMAVAESTAVTSHQSPLNTQA